MADTRVVLRIFGHKHTLPAEIGLLLVVVFVVFYDFVVPCVYQYDNLSVTWSDDWHFGLDDLTFACLLCARISLWQTVMTIVRPMAKQVVLWTLTVIRAASLRKLVLCCIVLALSVEPFIQAYTLLWPSFVDRVLGNIVITHLGMPIDTEVFVHNGNTKYWLTQKYRYKLEDVTFPCYIEYSELESTENPSVIMFHWYTNKRPFHPEEKYLQTSSALITPQTEAEAALKTRKVVIRQTLWIPFIGDDDFGFYDCIPSVFYEDFNAIFSTPRNAYILREITERTLDYPLPPNAIVHFVVKGRFRDSPHGVLVDHRLDGVPLHTLLEEDDIENECPIVVKNTYRHLVKNGPKHRQHVKMQRESINSVTNVYSFCANAASFGIYSFIIRRYFYNETSGTEDFVERDYPLKVRLVPTFPGAFGNVDDYVDASVLDQCWENGIPLMTDNCSKQRSHLKWKIKMHGELCNAQFVSLVFILPVLIFVYMVFVVTTVIMLLQEGSCWPQRVDTLCEYSVMKRHSQRSRTWNEESAVQHDVFLSYHQQDAEAARRVRAVLQGHQLRLFDSHQDVAPGAPEIPAWDTAMAASRSVLVLASAAYTSCRLLQLQFQAIHFHMLSGDLAEDRLLVLAAGSCLMSTELGPLSIIDLRCTQAAAHLHWWLRNVCSPAYPDLHLSQLSVDLWRDLQRLVFPCRPLCPVVNGDDDGRPAHSQVGWADDPPTQHGKGATGQSLGGRSVIPALHWKSSQQPETNVQRDDAHAVSSTGLSQTGKRQSSVATTTLPSAETSPVLRTEGDSSKHQSIVSPDIAVHQSSVSQNIALHHSSVSPGSSVHHSSVSPGSSVHHSSVSPGSSVHHSSVSPGSSVHHNSVSPGSSVHHSSVSHGSSVHHSSVSHGSSVLQSSVSHGSSVHQSSVSPGSSVHHSSVSPGSSAQQRERQSLSLSELCLGGRSYTPRDVTKAQHDVFLTYYEESRYDVTLADLMKRHLRRHGLRVFDANCDVTPGQEESSLVARGTESAAFVVVLSPEYCRHPLLRRLHFPRVLQAVRSGRVDPKNVLIVISSGRSAFMDDMENMDITFMDDSGSEVPADTAVGYDRQRGGAITTCQGVDAACKQHTHVKSASPCTAQDSVRQTEARNTSGTDIGTGTGQTQNQGRQQREEHTERGEGCPQTDYGYLDSWTVPDVVSAFPNVLYWSSNLGAEYHLQLTSRWAQQVLRSQAAREHQGKRSVMYYWDPRGVLGT